MKFPFLPSSPPLLLWRKIKWYSLYKCFLQSERCFILTFLFSEIEKVPSGFSDTSCFLSVSFLFSSNAFPHVYILPTWQLETVRALGWISVTEQILHVFDMTIMFIYSILVNFFFCSIALLTWTIWDSLHFLIYYVLVISQFFVYLVSFVTLGIYLYLLLSFWIISQIAQGNFWFQIYAFKCLHPLFFAYWHA